MVEPRRLQVLEQARVSPPPGSVTDSAIPLTYFDLSWLHGPTVPVLFFYQLNRTKTHILQTLVPNLKHSLSHSLQLFYPLAGTLIYSPEEGDPFIRYTDGNSVPFTIAESDGDFYYLSSYNIARDVTDLQPLVPSLATLGMQKKSLLAVQVTIFPKFGICIGITMHHVAADGSGLMHFIESWASICKSGGNASVITSLPLFDRTKTANLEHLKRNFLAEMKILKIHKRREKLKAKKIGVSSTVDTVDATFVMARAGIECLRECISTRTRTSHKRARSSTFVLTCAYVLVCLVKAKKVDRDKRVNFAFPVDCRSRLDPPLPFRYFGNCLGQGFVSVKVNDLACVDGILGISESVKRMVDEMDDGALEGGRFQISSFWASSHQVDMMVTGSPKYRVYAMMDFGWGRPTKVDQISKTGVVWLRESRDEEGGVEIGLALPRCDMCDFSFYFNEGLKEMVVHLESKSGSEKLTSRM